MWFILFFSAAAQTIQTIAGGGPRGFPATQTGLAQPAGLAVDSSGNVYVSLAQIHQIWKITSSGQVSLFAGNGSFPYNGDGIPAVNATLCQPAGLAFDASGNLYVADSGHNRVRKISALGMISTVAGAGTAGNAGDGGPASAAQLNNPVAVAVDSANNLYIADKNNQRVRTVSAAGVIAAFAGTGTAAFSGDGGDAVAASLSSPVGVSVDSSGLVYIADAGNFRVRKVAAGIISTVAGNGTNGYSGDHGPATAAQLNSVTGVAVDSSNNLYIVEAGDVRVVMRGQQLIVTFAGGPTLGYSGDGGSPASATFRNLAAIALDSGAANIYLADAGNGRIRKSTSTNVSTFAGNGTLNSNGSGQAAANASLLSPNSVAVDNTGSLVFADPGSSAIRKVALSGNVLTMLAGNGLSGTTSDGQAATGPAINPFALTFDANGSLYYVEQNRVRKVSNGVISPVANASNIAGAAGDGGPAAAANLNLPSGLAVAANGDLYVADTRNNRIRAINGQSGVMTTVAGTGAAGTAGDGGLATSATLNQPSAISLDGAGNLFEAELGSNRVRKISLATNIITALAGDGTSNFADNIAANSTGLLAPLSIFADQSSNVFIADQGHSRIRKVSAAGIITTVAGNGSYDVTGDGGSPLLASVNPLGITIDRAQNLYIADSSGRIRSVPVTACFFTLSKPSFNYGSSAGAGSLTVTATDLSCPYSVGSSSPSVTITSGGSGTGSGTVTFTLAANPGSSFRTATILGRGAGVYRYSGWIRQPVQRRLLSTERRTLLGARREWQRPVRWAERRGQVLCVPGPARQHCSGGRLERRRPYQGRYLQQRLLGSGL